MTYRTEQTNVDGILNRMLDNLSAAASSQSLAEGAKLRQKIGDLRSYYVQYMKAGTFASKLGDCFTAAYKANASLASLVVVRQALFEEDMSGDLGASIVIEAISFCLAIEARTIAAMTFESRDDVDAMIATMNTAFSTAREIAADFGSGSAIYQTLIALGGALINHLATTARPLPRMVTFTLNTGLPATTLANRVYYDASRWEEIVAENGIIHPAFCPREIRGLSN